MRRALVSLVVLAFALGCAHGFQKVREGIDYARKGYDLGVEIATEFPADAAFGAVNTLVDISESLNNSVVEAAEDLTNGGDELGE